MSGRGQVTSFIEPSGMTGAPNEVFKPYVMGNVTTEEGAELCAIVRGITPEMADEARKSLPLPVQASIFPRDGFKIVVYDLVKE